MCFLHVGRDTTNHGPPEYDSNTRRLISFLRFGGILFKEENEGKQPSEVDEDE